MVTQPLCSLPHNNNITAIFFSWFHWLSELHLFSASPWKRCFSHTIDKAVNSRISIKPFQVFFSHLSTESFLILICFTFILLFFLPSFPFFYSKSWNIDQRKMKEWPINSVTLWSWWIFYNSVSWDCYRHWITSCCFSFNLMYLR